MLQTKVGTFLNAANSAWMLSGICCAAITSIEMAKANAASMKVSSRVISSPRRRKRLSRGSASRSAGRTDPISSSRSVIAARHGVSCAAADSAAGRLWNAAHQVELFIRWHPGRVCDPVAHREERRDPDDVPSVLVGKAMLAQPDEVALLHFLGPQRHLDREVEHGALPRGDLRFAVVDRHLIGEQRLLFVDAHQRA